MKTFSIIFTAAVLSWFSAYTQNESTKWYFGKYAALDFMTNPPTILNNSAMDASEGCSSIADAAGNLLFYTDGVTVRNQQHMVMANGTGLLGNSTPSQSSFIIKQPNSSNIYYIFTIQGLCGAAGFNYSIVDMSLAAGMGSVTVKNATLFPSPCTEKLAATRHSNGVDYWVVVHEFNTINFRAYLLTSTGVNTTAVVSSVGPVDNNYLGCMKISATGKKLAAPQYALNQMGLFDFDNSTGSISNPLLYTTSSPNLWPYGCEFSPDGTKFYTTTLNPFTVMQWNLSAGSNAAILSSSVSVLNIPASYGSMQMQLAPNGKIYIAARNSQSLSVIHKPNVAGMGCNAVFGDQFIGITNININAGGLSWDGLPNMLAYPCYVSFDLVTNSVTCSGAATGSAAIINTTGNSSYLWTNGTNTFATQQLTNLSASDWTVVVTDTSGCATHSVFTIIQIPPSSFTPSILSSSLEVCMGNTISLVASGANSYTWSNGAQTSSIVVSPTASAQYSVSGADVNGCVESSSVITITVFPIPTISVTGFQKICNPKTVTLTASGAISYVWTSSITANTSSIVAFVGSDTQFTVSGTNVSGCTSSKVVSVTVGCTGIDELNINNNAVRVFPNPTGGILNIEIGDIDSKEVLAIIDLLGNEVLNIKNDTKQIDISTLKNGVYFIKVGKNALRFVKE